MFHQGDILKIENMSVPVIVVSKDIYNATENAIVCPVIKNPGISPLVYPFSYKKGSAVLCDEVKHLDLKTRGYSVIGSASEYDIIEISNIIESLFDYC